MHFTLSSEAAQDCLIVRAPAQQNCASLGSACHSEQRQPPTVFFWGLLSKNRWRFLVYLVVQDHLAGKPIYFPQKNTYAPGHFGLGPGFFSPKTTPMLVGFLLGTAFEAPASFGAPLPPPPPFFSGGLQENPQGKRGSRTKDTAM